MKLFLLVISVHFIAGALSISFLNRKLPVEARRKRWQKYFGYLVIFSVILTVILTDRNILLGCTIIIFSSGLFEILKLGKKPCEFPSVNRVLFLSLAAFSLLCLLFSFFILLPVTLIAFTYVIVIIFDGASQLAGQAFGKKKILPVISPGKTAGGLIGGIISASVTSVVLHNFASLSPVQSLIFGMVVCMASFTGDLAASAYKRAFGSKDFGNILPGQGGMLDRFDSFIASGAVIGFAGLFTCFSLINAERNISVYLGYSLFYTLILLTGELMHHLFRFKAEYSRIFAHLLAGICSLFFVILFTSLWYVIFLCVQSSVFMFASKKNGLLTSHHNVSRITNGSSFFFIGLLISYLFSVIWSDNSLFILPVLILSVSDPLASIAGFNLKLKIWPGSSRVTRTGKTVTGSIAFFLSAFIVLVAGMPFFFSLTTLELLLFSLLISMITTIVEAMSPFGLDNITIPVVASTILELIKVAIQ